MSYSPFLEGFAELHDVEFRAFSCILFFTSACCYLISLYEGSSFSLCGGSQWEEHSCEGLDHG